MKIATFTLCLSLWCAHQIYSQTEILGTEEYGRIFDVLYDQNQPDRWYAATMSNHIVTSVNNGQEWEVHYAHPVVATQIEQLKNFQQDKLTFVLKNSATSTDNRTVYVLDPNTNEIVHEYLVPLPDPNSDKEWINSYSIYSQDSQFALVSLGYKILLSNYEKVYYTTDGGNTWEMVYYTVNNLNIFTNNVAISPDNPQKLFIALGNGDMGSLGGLLISSDGGTTWDEKITGVTLDPIAFHPNDPNQIYVGSSIGFGSHPQNLYRSFDGGDTWNEVPIDWSDYILNCITSIGFNPTNPNHIVVLEEDEIVISYDGGTSWQNHKYENAYDVVDSYSFGTHLAFNPFDDNKLLITANYFPFHSQDQGVSLTRIKSPFFHAENNLFYTSTGQGDHLYYGVQFGYVHRDLTTGIENEYELMALNEVSNSPGISLIADTFTPGRAYTYKGSFMGSTLSVSDEHGADPQVIYTSFATHLHDVATHPDNPHWIWASFSSFGQNPELVKIDFSDLNNIQITPLPLPVNDLVMDIEFDPENSDHITLVIGTWVYKSTDGGASWTNNSNGLENLVPYSDLIFTYVQNPLNPLQFTLASSQGIYTSTDGGATWQLLTSGFFHNVAHATEANGQLVAVTHNSVSTHLQIHYSTDFGNSWEIVDPAEVYYISTMGTLGSTAFDFGADFVDIYIASAGLGLVRHTLYLGTVDVPHNEKDPNNLTVYPNPASDFIKIVSANQSIKNIQVFTVTGQLMAEYNGSQTQLDVSQWPAGLYFITVETLSGNYDTVKVIKK